MLGEQHVKNSVALRALKNFDPDIPTVKKYLPNED